MYPENRTGEGRREKALRADDVVSRNTGHEMYRQEGPRQQKGLGRDGTKCEHVGSRAQRGEPMERINSQKPSGQPGDTSQPEATCQGGSSRLAGAGG